jgi:retron-type reverse transcriptase
MKIIIFKQNLTEIYICNFSLLKLVKNCRRGLTVVKNVKYINSSFKSFSIFCEVTQSQKINKQVNNILNLFKNRINKASKTVKNTFTYNQIANTITEFEKFIALEQTIPLKNVYKFLHNPCFLLLAYISIKKKSVNLKNAKNTITLSSIKTLAKQIFSEKYKCTPLKRLYIEKLQSGKRQLNISSLRDKIVQKALLMLIQPKFELNFSKLSFGFRPKYNCHRAFDFIRSFGNRTV